MDRPKRERKSINWSAGDYVNINLIKLPTRYVKTPNKNENNKTKNNLEKITKTKQSNLVKNSKNSHAITRSHHKASGGVQINENHNLVSSVSQNKTTTTRNKRLINQKQQEASTRTKAARYKNNDRPHTNNNNIMDDHPNGSTTTPKMTKKNKTITETKTIISSNNKSKKVITSSTPKQETIIKTKARRNTLAVCNSNNNSKKKPDTTGTNKKKRNAVIATVANSKQALDEALIRLHSSSVPESLPCREYQFDDIYNFVTRKLLEDEDGGCMYISGVPGTGKTATLREVKQKLCQDRNLPRFRFIEINGLKLAQPNRFCSHFLMELDGIKKSNYQATEILTEKFSNMKIKKDFVILFIDELDYLKTKKQDILYHIFDWPNRKNSKLIVLAVANSMDLPERFLLNRVSSRLGLTRLLFQPYSYKELEQIVQSRLTDDHLAGFEVFEPDALELICRKVSAVSGDARRVLDICRRSVEITIADGCDKVTIEIVNKALKEIFHSIKNMRITQASIQEQIFLRAFLQNFRMSGLEEYQFIEIFKTHVDICRFEGHYVPTTFELSKVATNLDLSKIILLERSHSHLYRRIRLNVSPDDIAFALNLD